LKLVSSPSSTEFNCQFVPSVFPLLVTAFLSCPAQDFRQNSPEPLALTVLPLRASFCVVTPMLSILYLSFSYLRNIVKPRRHKVIFLPLDELAFPTMLTHPSLNFTCRWIYLILPGHRCIFSPNSDKMMKPERLALSFEVALPSRFPCLHLPRWRSSDPVDGQNPGMNPKTSPDPCHPPQLILTLCPPRTPNANFSDAVSCDFFP